MGWKRDDAKERMRSSFTQMKDVDVQELTREMDLENLSYQQARIVHGTHVYLDVTNFKDLLEERREDTPKLRKLLRHLTVYQRQAEKLLRTHDGALRVHFQSARLHFIVFKPYNTQDGAELERLKTAVTIIEQLRQLAALITGHTGITFDFEAGIDTGEAIATMNAKRGNRQLLFVGDPANRAAKALTGTPGERYAEGATSYEGQLPEASERTPLPKHFEKDVADDIESHPESGFDIFDVTSAPIDYDKLGKRVARLESSVTLYGDVSGFTAFVREASTLEDKKKAVQYLHVLRSEMQHIVDTDYDGDFIQFQGDRVQALLYETRTTKRFKSKTVEAAAALCSAIDLAKELYPDLSKLDMSCGADQGKVLVARVGLRDDKEVTVLGQSVATASGLQDKAGDGMTAISTQLWDGVEKNLQPHFELKDGHRLADIDVAKLEAKKQEAAKKSAERFDGPVRVGGTFSSGLSITPAAGGNGVTPAKSWSK